MKKKFEQYLAEIGIKGAYLRRTETVISFYEDLYSSRAFSDIFVSEYLDNDGRRQYESLWLLSSSSGLACEAKLFLTEDNYDAAIIKTVDHWIIEKTEYDFKNASDKSRMSLTFKFQGTYGGILKASKSNCDSLREIFNKYVKIKLATR